MKIIEQSWSWEQKPSAQALEIIEKAGRTCYKSEKLINADSAVKFAKMIVDLKHETVIEHIVASVRFITNRGVTHELVRHRMCSFSQESTRYVKYASGIEFIKPVWWDDEKYPEANKKIWTTAMEDAEKLYLQALAAGDTPEQAREILPHATKTEIVVTANLREWRHIFALRANRKSHPQIRALMHDCLKGFVSAVPVIFDDLVKS